MGSTGPSTGAGSSPTAGGGGGGGGIPLDFRRRETSRERLTLEWNFPVWKPAETKVATKGGTTSEEARRVLSRSEAFSLAAEGDTRPMLILRECDRCKGSDDALLSRTMDNEKTVLLAHYFRCVKLPVHVVERDHPFSLLFDPRRPAHLFFASPNGQDVTPLEGNQTQSDLWKHMGRWIDQYYDGSSKKMLRELQKILAQYDNVDSLEEEVRQRLNATIEKHGPKSPKVRKLEKKLAELADQRAKWIAKEEKLRASLTLKEPEEPEEPAKAKGVKAAAGQD